MTDENGVLSIDFLAGFTIFILAFIWVVSMIPGIMIGLQSYTIDYDAVAYRTGVILVEDPGWPASPPWESFNDAQKSDVIRFGLALSKDTPNILAQDKVKRFFCTTFIYPDDYHTRTIFGDYPYGFNISLMDLGGQNRSVGDVLPDGYGYIRRLVKIKGVSNATIGHANKYNSSYNKTDSPTNETTTHVFSILINNTKILTEVTDPAYQIDPAREQIMVNITDINSTIINNVSALPPIDNTMSVIILKNIKVYKKDGGLYSNVPLPASEFPYIDGNSARLSAMPARVNDSISLRISPYFFDQMKAQNSQIYIALGFDVSPKSTFLNNTQALPDYDNLDGKLTFENPNTTPFDYDYDAVNVTQPYLRDAVLDVAVWSGAATTMGGGTPAAGPFTIQAAVGGGGGGTISPIGSVSVSDGGTPSFTITHNTGYHITDVVVDGISQGAVSSYAFTPVHDDHTITAWFGINPPPTFTSISPASGPIAGGTPVTITGTNFVSGGSFGVTIGGTAATGVVWVDSSHITAVTPAGTAGFKDVVITNNDGQFVTGGGVYQYV